MAQRSSHGRGVPLRRCNRPCHIEDGSGRRHPRDRRLEIARLDADRQRGDHGAGAAALTVYAAVRIVRSPRHARGWIVVLVSAGLATLLNPYGVGLWRFLATT